MQSIKTINITSKKVIQKKFNEKI